MRKLKQDTVNQGVAGSSPASGAIFKGFAGFLRSRLVQYLAVCPILLASATAKASGKDSLYVYRDSGNMRYQCVADLVYIDTSGNSVAALDSCTMTSRDLRLWPVFPPHPIHLEYTGLQFNVMPTQDCQLVLHMLNQDRTTSTIVDCRSGQ